MLRKGGAVAVLVLLALSAGAAGPKRPRLELRVMPFMGPPTTEFLFVADLKGGDDSEELYCPEVEWDFGGAHTSLHEPECPPFRPGVTAIERRFSVSRVMSGEGQHRATVVLRKGDKVLGRATATYRVTWEKKPLSGSMRDPR